MFITLSNRTLKVYIANGVILPFTPKIVTMLGEKFSIFWSSVCFCTFLAALIVVHPVLVSSLLFSPSNADFRNLNQRLDLCDVRDCRLGFWCIVGCSSKRAILFLVCTIIQQCCHAVVVHTEHFPDAEFNREIARSQHDVLLGDLSELGRVWQSVCVSGDVQVQAESRLYVSRAGHSRRARHVLPALSAQTDRLGLSRQRIDRRNIANYQRRR